MTIQSYRTNEPVDSAEPNADAMIESLRAFGYSLEAAIADLIDNSITAEANNVWVDFGWDGADSEIILRDDGKGMDDVALVEAMRPGTRNPLERRDKKDLGRFGLGLKTASFSQCRLLGVLTRAAGRSVIYRCWDLDYVAQCHKWYLLKRLELAPREQIEQMEKQRSGTTVVWRKLDRVVGNSYRDDEAAHKRFLDSIDHVKAHLAMVFHRYLSDIRALKIWVNGRQLRPWDPFLRSEDTQRLGQESLTIHSGSIAIQPYVLPHHSKIDSKTHENAAGPRGWNDQQGFYVYRNKRLLVAGDWLGLGMQKEEHFKLARIQVDIPNTMDADWELDVRKSRARPPGTLRKDFKRIATATRSRASEIYRHRGKVLARDAADSQVFVWQKKVKQGKISYRINRDHPLIARVLVEQNGSKDLSAVLRLIEETVPVSYISVNNAEAPDGHAMPFEGAPPSEVKELMLMVLNALLKQGVNRSHAMKRISAMEPFNGYPELTVSMSEHLEQRAR